LHWYSQTQISRLENLICIGINKNAYWFFTLNVLLFKLKKRNKYIFIHSHNPLMSIISIYQSNLFTVHDALYYLTGVTKHKFNNFFWFLEKILYLRCKYVHFISNYAKKMSLYKSEKDFKIISNTSHYESFILNKLNLDVALTNFNEKATKIFIVRSIEERALINLIIDVAEKLKTSNIQFLIAGKGPLIDFYRNKIKSLTLENIVLLGYVNDDNLINYYKDCDIVMVPAAYGEGFGLPIIEGYLYDKPVIASNVCAIPEVILSKEYLFENNVESIISKLYSAINQNGIKYGQYYEKQFSNKVVISKMTKLYKKLI
jgi:glycosyltransferase involved in cell wall biosynthesis